MSELGEGARQSQEVVKNPNKISRRDVLKLGAAAGAGVGMMMAGLKPAQAETPIVVATPTLTNEQREIKEKAGLLPTRTATVPPVSTSSSVNPNESLINPNPGKKEGGGIPVLETAGAVVAVAAADQIANKGRIRKFIGKVVRYPFGGGKKDNEGGTRAEVDTPDFEPQEDTNRAGNPTAGNEDLGNIEFELGQNTGSRGGSPEARKPRRVNRSRGPRSGGSGATK